MPGNRAPARILVTGNAGSGKSTFAGELGAALGVPVFSLDVIVWKPGWRKTAPDEKAAAVTRLVELPAWVIEGVSEAAERRADLVVFLDAPPLLCAWRCAKRNRHFLFRSRPGLPPGCPEWRIAPRLLRIIWRFDRRVRPAILERAARDARYVRISSAPERQRVRALARPPDSRTPRWTRCTKAAPSGDRPRRGPPPANAPHRLGDQPL